MRIRIIFLLTCILLFDSTVIAQDDTADSQSSISEPDETQDDEPIFDAEMLEEILAENEPEAEPIKPIALPPVKTELAPFWGELWAGAGISANLSLSGFAGLGWGAGARWSGRRRRPSTSRPRRRRAGGSGPARGRARRP